MYPKTGVVPSVGSQPHSSSGAIRTTQHFSINIIHKPTYRNISPIRQFIASARKPLSGIISSGRTTWS